MDRVRCDPARHKALHECDFEGWGVTDCTEEEGVVALICEPGSSVPGSPAPSAPLAPALPPPIAPALPPAPLGPPATPPRSDADLGLPLVSHTCQLSVTGGGTGGSGSDGVTASLRCWREAGTAEGPEAVRVEAGAELLGQLLGASSSDLALSPIARPSYNTSAAANASLPDWGLTFSHVPHLRLLNSVLTDLPLSTVGPLLAFRNVTHVTWQNVTLRDLTGPRLLYGFVPPTVYGASAVDSAQSVSVLESTCERVVEAAGWACLHATLRPGGLLYITGSTFASNHVARPGHMGTICVGASSMVRPFGLGALVVVHDPNGAGVAPPGSGEPTRPALAPPPGSGPAAGAGATTAPAGVRGSAEPAARTATRIVVEGSRFDSNRGGCGTALTLSLPTASSSGGHAAQVDMAWTGSRVRNNTYLRPDLYRSRTPVSAVLVELYDMIAGAMDSYYQPPLEELPRVNASFVGCEISDNAGLHAGNSQDCYAAIGFGSVTLGELGLESLEFNQATSYGGVATAPSGLSLLRVADAGTSLSYNTAGDRGGAVHIIGGDVDAVVIEDSASAVGNSAGLSGGLLYAGKGVGAFVASGDALVSAHSAKLGGALYATEGIASLTVEEGAALSGNRAASDGGAVYAGGSISQLRLSGGSLLNNSGVDRGGAVFAAAILNATASGCVITGNTAGSGGGIFTAALGQLSLTGCSLVGNAAVQDGGFLHSPAPASSRWLFSDTLAANNTAGRHGGVAFVESGGEGGGSAADDPPAAVLQLTNGSTLAGNTAGGSGGALAVAAGGSIRLEGGSFEGNAAYGGGGGAVAALAPAVPRASGARLWVEGASFGGNLAPTGSGGAVLAAAGSVVQLYGCELYDNAAAVDGGAVACSAADGVLLQSCTLTGNLALGSGGGLSAAGCGVVGLNASALRGNVATRGGALGVSQAPAELNASSTSSRLLWVASSTLEDNLAARASPPPASGAPNGYGGAVFAEHGSAHVLLAGTRLAGNAAWLGADVASTQRCGAAGPGNSSSADVTAAAALEGLAAQLSKGSLPAFSLAQAAVFWPGLNTCSLLVLDAASAAFRECTGNGLNCSISAVAPLANNTNPGAQHALSMLAAALPSAKEAPSLVAPDSLAAAAWVAHPDASPVQLVGTNASAVPQLGETVGDANGRNGVSLGSWRIEAPPAGLRLSCLGSGATMGAADGYAGCLSSMLRAKTGARWVLSARLHDTYGLPVSSVPGQGYRVTLELRGRAGPAAPGPDPGPAGPGSALACLPALGGSAACDSASAIAAAASSAGMSIPVRTDGLVEWRDLSVTGWPGEYEITLRTEGPTQILPLVVPLVLSGCEAGEAVAVDAASLALPLPPADGSTCAVCPRRQVGILPDARSPLGAWALAAVAANSSIAAVELPPQQRQELEQTASLCNSCPARATCTGGSLVVPPPGRWHSAAKSLSLHDCPNPDACSGLSSAGAAALRSYPPSATAALSSTLSLLGSLEDRALLLAVCQDQAIQLTRSSVALAPSAAANSSTAAAPTPPPCVLGGVPPSDPRSYVQLQCTEGYTGNLCAACQPGYSLSTDFECSRCPPFTRTLLLGLLALAVSAVFIVCTTVANLGTTREEGVGSADFIKILVVHMQYFVIIARLNIARLPKLQSLTAALATVTGAEDFFAYRASCIAPNTDSTQQALVSLLSAIVTPLLVTAGALAIWAVRYCIFNRAVLRRSRGLSRERTPAGSGRETGLRLALSGLRVSRGSRGHGTESAAAAAVAKAASDAEGTGGAEGGEEDGVAAVEEEDAGDRLSQRPSRKSSAARRLASALQLRALAESSASIGAGLKHADQTLSLPRQLGIVTMIAVFMLYPAWAAAGFSVFSCYAIDRGGDTALGQLEQATHRWGYWARDMNQECYVGVHAGLYVPLGVVTLLLFCLGPPATSFAIMWRVRHRLKDYHTMRLYGYMYSRYRPHVCWWDASVQLQTLALVAVEVFGRGLIVQYQALLLLAVLTAVGGTNVLVAPLASRLLRRLEFSSSMVLCLTITLSLYFAVGDSGFADSPEGTGVAVVILVLNLALIAAFAACLLRRAWPQLSRHFATAGRSVRLPWPPAVAACCAGGGGRTVASERSHAPPLSHGAAWGDAAGAHAQHTFPEAVAAYDGGAGTEGTEGSSSLLPPSGAVPEVAVALETGEGEGGVWLSLADAAATASRGSSMPRLVPFTPRAKEDPAQAGPWSGSERLAGARLSDTPD
ncbi:hypothetical protein HYH03_016717 [Edaphochlamys debaryana]|uniref:SRCR domain-containing protein n=1 Tax=Edaphochlamys debaryana TaxID=47281 RepID=A0A835XJE0_9CHLO|nr:hypothetical protein HYH03_016717 [Edaphochlamys debaryana]|eukprot:KAG2484485.1 hypothetical protein HYH03_016717 [Edaphochlamys debaryana]